VLHGPGSHCRQKGIFNLDALERGFEVVDVGFDGGMADVVERLVAVKDPCMMPDGSASSLVKVIGKFRQVSAEYGSRPKIGADRFLDEAAESLARIARELVY
jgi:hypothetical protein